MSVELTVECEFHFDQRGRGGRKELCVGANPTPAVEPGRVPRVARLMALAIRFEAMLRDGIVASQAELAALGHVSCARVSQIMNLLLLAPDIQEEILHLPRTLHGRDPIHLRQLQPIAAALDWRKQRQLWRQLQLACPENPATQPTVSMEDAT
jgi:hypothetical protein